MIYATIAFVNREDAGAAKEAMNGTILGTRHIRVEWNRKRGKGSDVVPVAMYSPPRRNVCSLSYIMLLLLFQFCYQPI
jgi:hypothetical protein